MIPLASPTQRSVPSFAFFARGGDHKRIRNGFCAERARSCVGSIATRRFDKLRAGSCRKRKDRAPSSPTSGRQSNASLFHPAAIESGRGG